MTALVSLLFIAMIPFDCKITFSLHLLIYSFIGYGIVSYSSLEEVNWSLKKFCGEGV